MNKDYTDVTVILDRSGSMASCKLEAQNGLNHFVEEQKKQPGKCIYSLVQFDNEYELVHDAINIQDVPPFELEPRGMTALLDAVGRSINTAGERFSKMQEDERPGLVIFVIVTDGIENSSHEFNKDQIRKMIEHQQDEYSWQFTFLGANQDAFGEAASLGIRSDAVASYAASKSAKAFSSAASNVARMRSSAISGMSVRNAYTDDERDDMN